MSFGDEDDDHYRRMLWTAPELLRTPSHEWPRYGSPKGDVYSFGVIAQEVLYRTSPFFLDEESPKGKGKRQNDPIVSGDFLQKNVKCMLV